MAKELSDYALGSVPPFGELVRAALYVDAHLVEHQSVAFAAGTHTDSITMKTADLLALGPHTVVEVCRTAEA